MALPVSARHVPTTLAATAQVPPLHVPPVQSTSQPPQFCAFVSVSTHVPLHTMSPMGHSVMTSTALSCASTSFVMTSGVPLASPVEQLVPQSCGSTVPSPHL